MAAPGGWKGAFIEAAPGKVNALPPIPRKIDKSHDFNYFVY
jgi:hypothetical protein